AAPAASAHMTYRVLYLDHAPILGGAQIVLLNLVRSLQAEEWTPVVATNVHSPLHLALAGSGIDVHSVPFNRLNQSGPAISVRWLRAGITVARLVRHENVN